MKNCLLCKNRPADKKGSHIIPLFLIQTMINEDGKKGRNKQVSIELGTFTTGLYFGREVSLEKVNKVLGHELSDNEVESQSDPIVVDNIFCSVCETRFSHIESHYSNLFSSWLEFNDNIQLSKCDSNSALLFWSSVIWRVSASKIAGYTLGNEEEKLRVILDETLPNNVNELKKKVLESKILKSVGYCLAYCPEHKDPTSRLFIAHPDLSHPACIVINQHVLFFNPKGEFNELEEGSCWGFEKFNKQDRFNSLNNANEFFTLMNAEEFNAYTVNIFKYKAYIFQENIEKHCVNLYLQIFKIPMPVALLHLIMNRIIHEDEELTSPNRYIIERINKIFAEEIIKAK